MPNDLNQCNFIGRVGKEVNTRYLPDGKAVASFSIAVGSSWKNKESGEKQESTEWINISVFGKLAEICSEYLRKGSKVFISGKFKTDKYKDKEGNDRYSTKVIANDMQMLDSRSGPPTEQSSEQESNQRPPVHAQNQQSPPPDFDDVIPF